MRSMKYILISLICMDTGQSIGVTGITWRLLIITNNTKHKTEKRGIGVRTSTSYHNDLCISETPDNARRLSYISYSYDTRHATKSVFKKIFKNVNYVHAFHNWVCNLIKLWFYYDGLYLSGCFFWSACV